MFQMAFPSWVTSGGIGDNASFICERWQRLCEAGLVPGNINPSPEIGLCFFESAACLDYGAEDLPASLAWLPCTWHVHLPLDLPFCTSLNLTAAQVRSSFAACRRLIQKTEFLNMSYAVLHPPAVAQEHRQTADALGMFKEMWEDAGYTPASLLLENQPESNLLQLSLHVQENGLGGCLDLAHLYMNPARKIDSEGLETFMMQSRLWHINAPGPDYKGHSPLNALTAGQEREYRVLFEKLGRLKLSGQFGEPGQIRPANYPTFMLELFNWEYVEQSLAHILTNLYLFDNPVPF